MLGTKALTTSTDSRRVENGPARRAVVQAERSQVGRDATAVVLRRLFASTG